MITEKIVSGGVKTGQWKIYRKNQQISYSYLNGQLNGTYISLIDNKTYLKETYVLGSLNGESVLYFRYKPKQISTSSVYEFGRVVERKEYNGKGELTSWYNLNFTDGTFQKFYEKGIKIREHFLIDSIGVSRTLEYFKNGNIEKDYQTYTAYLAKDFFGIDFEPPYWYKFLMYTDYFTYPDDCISYKDYHSNGQLYVSYDLTKDTLVNPILFYNKEGQRIREYKLGRDTFNFFYKTEYDGETQQRTQESIYYYTNQYSLITYDESNQIESFSYNPEYLNLIYPDSSGFVLCRSNTYGKKLIQVFNLLHSSVLQKIITYKDEVISEVKTRNYSENGLPMAELTYIEHSKGGEFEVHHIHKYYAPKTSEATDMTTRMYINRYYRNLELDNNNLQQTTDSLDYQVFYKGKPFTGELQVHDKRMSDRKGLFKVKALKKQSKREDQTVLKVKDYSTYSWSSKKELQLYDGFVTRINSRYKWWSGGEATKYIGQKKTGEMDESCGDAAYYVKGKRHGLYVTSGVSKEYYKGKLHGEVMEFGYYSPESSYDDQIDYRAHYNLDTLQGWFQSYVRPMEVSQKVYFDKGHPTGTYWRGNVTAPTSAQIELDHGYLKDTAYYYFNEGTLKSKVYQTLEDSVYFYPYYLYELNEHSEAIDYLSKNTSFTPTEITSLTRFYVETGFNLLDNDKLIDLDGNRTGDYEYYYKNGILASQGRVEKGSKVGTWKYWDLSGGLFKQVQHDTGWFVNAITKDSTYYFGKVQMWYPNGNELLTGLILSQFERFKCDQEMKVGFENLYYLSFFDKDGKQTLNQNGGKVFEYHNNSEIRLEGEMKDGKRWGVWKFYDPNGRLEEIGKYEDGVREGLWISGDLEAVPYYEDLCVSGEVDAYKFPDIKVSGVVTQPISIRETQYSKNRGREKGSILLLPLY